MAMSGLIAALLSSCSERGNIDENEKAGERIVNALYAYKQAYGVFPNTLNDLVPDYLDKIPKTAGWHDFFYATDPIESFILDFKAAPRTYCGYTDKLKGWECGYYNGK
jgi:hypothetical protein